MCIWTVNTCLALQFYVWNHPHMVNHLGLLCIKKIISGLCGEKDIPTTLMKWSYWIHFQTGKETHPGMFLKAHILAVTSVFPAQFLCYSSLRGITFFHVSLSLESSLSSIVNKCGELKVMACAISCWCAENFDITISSFWSIFQSPSYLTEIRSLFLKLKFTEHLWQILIKENAIRNHHILLWEDWYPVCNHTQRNT